MDILRDDGAAFSMTVDQFSKHARDDAFTMAVAQKCTRPDREIARAALLESQVKILDTDIALVAALPVAVDSVKLP